MLADLADLVDLVVNVEELHVKVDIRKADVVPAGAFGSCLSRVVNDPCPVGADRGDDPYHVGDGVGVKEVSAVIGRCPYHSLCSHIGESLPIGAPADVKAGGKSDLTELCVNHTILIAGDHVSLGDLGVNRVHLTVLAHYLAIL